MPLQNIKANIGAAKLYNKNDTIEETIPNMKRIRTKLYVFMFIQTGVVTMTKRHHDGAASLVS